MPVPAARWKGSWAELDLPTPILCLVTDERDLGLLLESADAALSGGVNMIQVRRRARGATDLYACATALVRLAKGRALVMVNDRMDVAEASGADGVHLPEAGPPVSAARRLLGRGRLVGRSIHAAMGPQLWEGADYLIFGNVFATASHQLRPPLGTDLLATFAKSTALSVLAIGGIDPPRAHQAIRSGAAGVASISFLLDSADSSAAAGQLLAAMVS